METMCRYRSLLPRRLVEFVGGYGLTSEAELVRLTRERSLRLTDLCAELGRDPVALRRSLVCFPRCGPGPRPRRSSTWSGTTGPSASTSSSCTGRGLGTCGQAGRHRIRARHVRCRARPQGKSPLTGGFLPFGLLTLVALLYLWREVPETKCRSL